MLIGSRELTLRDGDREFKIPVRLFAPQCEPDGAWKCRYDIGWPEGLAEKEIFGADSMQAIVLALQMIGCDIYNSELHEAGQLRWDKHGAGYGFPVMPAYRDCLEGDDAKYF